MDRLLTFPFIFDFLGFPRSKKGGVTAPLQHVVSLACLQNVYTTWKFARQTLLLQTVVVVRCRRRPLSNGRQSLCCCRPLLYQALGIIQRHNTTRVRTYLYRSSGDRRFACSRQPCPCSTSLLSELLYTCTRRHQHSSTKLLYTKLRNYHEHLGSSRATIALLYSLYIWP